MDHPSQSQEVEQGDDCTCSKCLEKVTIKDSLSAGRTGRICKLCYNSGRSLSEHYRKRGKSDEWSRMPPEKKRKLIVENKAGGGIRGKARNIKITEQAQQLLVGIRNSVNHLWHVVDFFSAHKILI